MVGRAALLDFRYDEPAAESNAKTSRILRSDWTQREANLPQDQVGVEVIGLGLEANGSRVDLAPAPHLELNRLLAPRSHDLPIQREHAFWQRAINSPNDVVRSKSALVRGTVVLEGSDYNPIGCRFECGAEPEGPHIFRG